MPSTGLFGCAEAPFPKGTGVSVCPVGGRFREVWASGLTENDFSFAHASDAAAPGNTKTTIRPIVDWRTQMRVGRPGAREILSGIGISLRAPETPRPPGNLACQHRRCPHGMTAPSRKGAAALSARAGDVLSVSRSAESGLTARQAGHFFTIL